MRQQPSPRSRSRTRYSLKAQVPQTNLSTRSEEHTSELQSRENLVCRLLLEKKKHLTDNDTMVGAHRSHTVASDKRVPRNPITTERTENETGLCKGEHSLLPHTVQSYDRGCS